MAHFPDLTPYAYGHAEEPGDLNVGWLERGHDYTRGPVPAGLVPALLKCATRPARLYRGIHVCDFCPAVKMKDFGATTLSVEGREVMLGNGEIRVRGVDGRWYSAPTLVAHYVATHEYQPPQAFVDAVLRRAATLYVLAGDQLRRLTALHAEQRLAACVRALRAIPTRAPDALEIVCAKVETAVPGELHTWHPWAQQHAQELQALEEPVVEACRMAFFGFAMDPPDAEQREKRVVWTLTSIFEQAADLGADVATL